MKKQNHVRHSLGVGGSAIALVLYGLSGLFVVAPLRAAPALNLSLSTKPSGDVVPFSDGRIVNFPAGLHFKIDGITIDAPGAAGKNIYALPTPSVPSFLKITGSTPSYTPASTIPTLTGSEALTNKGINGLYLRVGTAVGTSQSLTIIDTPSDTFSLSIIKSGGWSGNLTPVFRFPHSTGNDYTFPQGPAILATVGRQIQPTSDDTVASAPTLDLSNVKGPQVDVTGTTTINAITMTTGRELILRFTGSTTLASSSSILLAGGKSRPTASGDIAAIVGTSSGVVTVKSFEHADGYADQTFDNIFMKPGGNIGFANLSVPYFDVGRSSNSSDGGAFLRFTKGDHINLVKQDGSAGIALDISSVTGSTKNISFHNRDGTLADDTDLALKANLLSPSFTTPSLGVAAATSINKVAITSPATSATLTIANGKTLTASNTLTFTGTDGSTLNVGSGGTLGALAFLSSPLGVTNGGTGQTTYTDGQLNIGNSSGNTLTKATLTGTSNQVVVTNGNGSITLSLPQNIATGSSPTFAGVTVGSISLTNGAIGNLGEGSNWLKVTSDPANGGTTWAFRSSPTQGSDFNSPSTQMDFRIKNASVDPFMRMYESGGLYYGTVAGITNPGANNFNIHSGVLKVANVQVVSTRDTGWTAWTGTGSKATKAVSTATTADNAAAIKSILDALIAHGLIGP